MTDETNTICGRAYTVVPPQKPKYYGRSQGTPKARFLVDGVTHRGGALIRFKSLAGAERHIRNMRLVKTA